MGSDRFKYIKYFLSFLPGALFELAQKYVEILNIPPYIGFTAISFISFVLLLLLDCIKVAIAAKKSGSSKMCLIKLDELGAEFGLSDGSQMIDVKDSDINRMEDIESQENVIRRKLSSVNQIIYHSVTAKENLPWVEYVLWTFLRRAKERLGCKIVISLHYDEESRENGLYTERDRRRYIKIKNHYASLAKAVIGNDIKIIDEEDFHRREGKFFAQNFHNIFVKHMLTNVKQLENGEIDYRTLKRKLSYLESVFPIMCLTRKSGHFNRVYVLDRVHAHAIWEEDEKLRIYRDRHGILLITSQTICNDDGTPIRIFKPGETIDINADDEMIESIVLKTDESVKKNVYRLVSICLGKQPPSNYDNLDSKCISAIIEARASLRLNQDQIIGKGGSL